MHSFALKKIQVGCELLAETDAPHSATMQTTNHIGMTAMCRRGRKHRGKEKEEHFMIQYAKRMGAMAYTANVVSN